MKSTFQGGLPRAPLGPPLVTDHIVTRCFVYTKCCFLNRVAPRGGVPFWARGGLGEIVLDVQSVTTLQHFGALKANPCIPYSTFAISIRGRCPPEAHFMPDAPKPSHWCSFSHIMDQNPRTFAHLYKQCAKGPWSTTRTGPKSVHF